MVGNGHLVCAYGSREERTDIREGILGYPSIGHFHMVFSEDQ